MKIEDLIVGRLWRVEAFDGLPISSAFWNDSLEFQNRHRQLHGRVMHRPGIVYGLEVVPVADGTKVLVAPGVGIDPEGNVIVLDRPRTYPIKEEGRRYILIYRQDSNDTRTAIRLGNRDEHWRKEDGRVIDHFGSDHLPDRPYLELARISRKGADEPIREPVQPLAPGPNEINRLHRQRAFPFCLGDISVAELSVVPRERSALLDTPNRGGLYQLLQEASVAGFHVHYREAVSLGGESIDSDNLPTLLYLSQSAAFVGSREGNDRLAANLQRFLSSGGTLLVDAARGSAEFTAAFNELARSLSVRMKKVEPGHTLLTACHLFPAAPPGANGGELTADTDSGVVLFTGDYGGAWQGKASSREGIRQAVEMGINLLAYAAARKRLVELSRMT